MPVLVSVILGAELVCYLRNRLMEIPSIKLNNGVSIPIIGNGPASIGYTAVKPKSITGLPLYFQKAFNKIIYMPMKQLEYVDAVANSFKIGFTLLDYSASYGDGKAIAQAINKSGIKREKLFITSRVSNKQQITGNIRQELMDTLHSLKTDYIDLYMFHWPVSNVFTNTWLELEKLYKEGLCRAIGVANCNIHHLEEIQKISSVTPSVNQFEIHPLFTQKELIKYCQERTIVVQGYTPIARFDDRLIRLPKLHSIAQKHNKTIVQIILRWHIQNGVIPIVRSLNKKRQAENIDIFNFQLSTDEILYIDSLNINSRLRYDPDNCDFSIL